MYWLLAVEEQNYFSKYLLTFSRKHGIINHNKKSIKGSDYMNQKDFEDLLDELMDTIYYCLIAVLVVLFAYIFLGTGY